VPPAKETSSACVKRGVIFSSDEDDEEEPAPTKRLQKGKVKQVGASTDDDDEAERSLRALRAIMDVDDGMFYLSYPTFHFPLYFFNGGVQNIIFTPHNPPSTTNPSTTSGSPPEDVDEDVHVEMAAADARPEYKAAPT
jgi:hypothetical protein